MSEIILPWNYSSLGFALMATCFVPRISAWDLTPMSAVMGIQFTSFSSSLPYHRCCGGCSAPAGDSRCWGGGIPGGVGWASSKQILEGEEAAQATGSRSVSVCRSDDRGFIPKAQSAAFPYPDQKPDLVHSVLSLPSSTSIDSALRSVQWMIVRSHGGGGLLLWLAHTTVSGKD